MTLVKKSYLCLQNHCYGFKSNNRQQLEATSSFIEYIYVIIIIIIITIIVINIINITHFTAV
jgi:hypothetical protein